MSLIKIIKDSELESFSQRDVSFRVYRFLRDKKINVDYNPEEQTAKTWYGRTLRFEFVSKKGFSYGMLGRQRNVIDVGKIDKDNNDPHIHFIPKSDEEITRTVLHEKTHHDIGIIETPVAISGLTFIYWKQLENIFLESIKERSLNFTDVVEASIVSILAAGLYSLILREYIVDSINYLRYGLKGFMFFNNDSQK